MAKGPLQGKVAIVTGAGSPIGIGHAVTVGFVLAGARVAMIDINQQWLEESANDVRQIGGEDSVLPIIADVTDNSAVEMAVSRTIKKLGGLHILVNNAGANPRSVGLAEAGTGNFWEVSSEAWERVVAINLNGAFFLARTAVSHMLEQQWGRIIGVTTSLDTMYRKGESPYGPSKAGHEALVATMSSELAGTGVTANVLVPGGRTNTNILGPGVKDDRSTMLQSEVMQAPAVWLASEDSGKINGRRINASYWDESLPLGDRLAKASAPAAWPQLGRYATVSTGE